MKYLLNLFALLLLMTMASCSKDPTEWKIPNKNSTISGEQSELAQVVKSKPSILTVEEKNGLWNFKVTVTLSNVKQLMFGDCQGSTFELRLLTEDGTQLDYDFTPGATDKGAQKASENLMDLMSSAPKTKKEFTFHYTTDNKDEVNKLKKDLETVTGVEIINFDFAGQFFETDGEDEQEVTDAGAEDENSEMTSQDGMSQDIAVTFSIDKKYNGGYSTVDYKDNYRITLHANGDADIHTEIHYPYGGEVGKPTIDDYTGSWAERDIKKGAGFVSYYDIEFNNGERDLNWCIDKDIRYVFLSWDGFLNNNSKSRFAVTRVK